MRRRARGSEGRGGLGGGRWVAVAGMAGLGLVALHGSFVPPARAGFDGGPSVERISVASDGTQGNDRSLLPAPNADGSVVGFKSSAFNLVPNDTNEKVDIFVRDRNAGTTTRVSVSDIPGQQANDNSFPPALDAAGRFVAFGSLASNLVRGDFNLGADVFVYDREEGTTTNLTVVPDNHGDGRGGGGAPDLAPSVSADGELVAFTSSADDLVATDQNETNDVFVRDRLAEGPFELISQISAGAQAGHSGNGPSAGPAISADGCVVAFYSDASNLVSGDTNQFRDVFVRNRCDGFTERVSVSTTGEQGNRPSQAAGFSVAISADGRYVGFASDATNLVVGDDNNATDIFVRDREAGTTTRVSYAFDGGSPNGPSQFASISGDGRFVVFQSSASNLVEEDTNGRTDIFVADMIQGRIERVSLTESGDQANGDSNSPQISADGSTVVFQSDATNLVPDDTNGFADAFAAVNPLAGPPPGPTDTPTEGVTPSPTAEESVTPTETAPSESPTPTATTERTLTPTTGGTVAPTATPTLANTATPTGTSGTGTPTRTPTVTATGSTGGGGGGGGCSCRIDGRSETAPDWGAGVALGFPLLLWVLRARRRRRAPAAAG